jgi:putative transposase
MSRPRRVDYPGATHHVAALAVDGQVAFREADDRISFLARLEKIVELYEWNCTSFCLMSTHFHLILHTPLATLSRGMQHLCSTYAQWFNWKYGRRGHLFGGRFGSVEILDELHLFNAYRYVALNPVRAGICREPEAWQWSSFRALVGLEDPPEFLDVGRALELFGHERSVRQSAFREFVESDLDDQAFPLVRIDGR